MPLDPGSLIAGKYRLERALARGGMGSVWIARHLQLDAPIAIKFMDPSYAGSPEARMRFEREARACARLKSPHIIQVHDYGLAGDAPYIVMELLDGEDLGSRLRRGRLTLAAAAPIALQIGKGLRTAHEAGIIHRDLKPANIFLCRHQDEDLVKVLDFGIAKAIGEPQASESTTTGTVIGSPHYMSPEQIRAFKNIDHRADLWSLGVILFRCVTGRLPFPGDQMSAVLVSICADPIPLPSQVAPDLGPEVDQFFARALARDPAQRFQTARELAEAFVALAGAHLPRAYMPSFSGTQPSVAAVTNGQPSRTGGTFSPGGHGVTSSPARHTGAMAAALIASVVLLGTTGGLLVWRSRERVLPVAVVAPPTAAAITEPVPVITEAAPASAPTTASSTTAPAPIPSATVPASAKPPLPRPPPLPVAKKKDPTFGF